MRRLVAVLGSLAIATTIVVTPTAASGAASTQIGNSCTATDYDGGFTYLVATAAPGGTLPVAAPSSGVITKATFVLPAEAGAGPYPVKVKTVRTAAAPGQFTVVAESASIDTSAGTVTADLRLPINAGERLGLGGAGALLCSTPNAADTLAVYEADVAPGTTAAPIETIANNSLPVVATIEPDVDKDGFGDDTQDLCPQSPAVQSACPKVKLDTFGLGQNGSILALVVTSTSAKVKVTGVAKVDGRNVKLTSKAKKVKPGQLGRFTLRLPAALKAALAQLPASRSIAVKLTATAPQVGTTKKAKDTAIVRLRGTR